MDRKSFLKLSATSLVAMKNEGVRAAIFDSAPQKNDGISVRFLGTGAADWNGIDSRGEHRRLSSILLDSRTLVDFTPSCIDMIPTGVEPDSIIYTHSHDDHYNPEAALKVGVKRVYLSQTWYDIAIAEFKTAAKKLGLPIPQIIPLYVGQAVDINGLTVTPLPASHATGYKFEQTLMYLIERAGVRLLYATDTGGIPAIAARIAGIDAHDKDGKPITAIIFEATMGMDHDDDFRIFTHTSVGGVERIVRVLEKTKRYTPPMGQPVYLTHMARTLHSTQAELDATLPQPLRAAYDGLEVAFKSV